MNQTLPGKSQRPESIVRRDVMVPMLRAALESGEYRFARSAALQWLAAYPGDLEVSALQARIMLSEGRPAQVIPALELLCRKDPLGAESYHLLALACQPADAARYAFAVTSLFAIKGLVSPGARIEAWGESLRQAIEALEAGQYAQADMHVHTVLQLNPDLLLAAVVHLLINRAGQEALTVYRLAQLYHTRWSDCLLFRLVLAETQLELGSEPEAVKQMHLCVARDSTGLVARRLWGEAHPYRCLWPEEMVIHFDLPIPAGVASRMGWNRLGPGEIRLASGPAPVEAQAAPMEDVGDLQTPVPASSLDGAALPAQPAAIRQEQPEESVGPEAAGQGTIAQNEVVGGANSSAQKAGVPESQIIRLNRPGKEPTAAHPELEANRPPAAEDQQAAQPISAGAPSPVEAPKPFAKSDSSSGVAQELDMLAKKIKQPGPGRADGRFPVYVIFSSKEGLNRQYGPRTTDVLDNELRRLAGLVRKRKGWGAVVYYPDDTASASQCGLLPMDGSNPWKLKHALQELDSALGKRGERIGALLIVGGDPVVPFHRLPNPTDDVDAEIASDNPYATLDSNYFIPEWSVGRLPGESGPDAGLLLEHIRQMQRYHAGQAKTTSFFGLNFQYLFRRVIERLLPSKPAQSFGYTAAVWRRSSLAVFRPIGAPHTVLASPPECSGSFDRERILASGLGYYNLHGLEDSPSWYGQRDPMEAGDSDYPVALSPEDLRRNGHAPRIVFSEACYGGHTLGKNEKNSLALKFLSMGTSGVVASTCIAYGSVNTPLIAADLLGNRFWQHMKSGCTAGDALLQAKVDLAWEMERRQGFLDGEDQKTLISFVLYGDPLAAYEGFRVVHKAAPRAKDHPAVKTVCDRSEGGFTPTIPPEVFKQVKGLLAEYLPGADLAELHFSQQHSGCDGKGHHCPTSEMGGNGKKKTARHSNGRMVVTASKQVMVAQHMHRHYMRMTLDDSGKPVKVSISR